MFSDHVGMLTDLAFESTFLRHFFLFPQQQGKLTDHNRTAHSKARNYRCLVCGKTFQVPRYLKSHREAVHEGRRDFVCDFETENGVCGKRFSERGSRRRHFKSVHEKKRDHKCEVEGCGMLFARKSHLKVHYEGVHVRGNQHGRKRKRAASPVSNKAGSVAGSPKEADADVVPEPQSPLGRKRQRAASPAPSKAGSAAGSAKEADADAVPEPQSPQTPDPAASPMSPMTAGPAQPPKRRMMPRLKSATS